MANGCIVRQKYAAARSMLKLRRITMARLMAEVSGELEGPGPSSKSLIVPYCLLLSLKNGLLYERMSIDWHDLWLLLASAFMSICRGARPNRGHSPSGSVANCVQTVANGGAMAAAGALGLGLNFAQLMLGMAKFFPGGLSSPDKGCPSCCVAKSSRFQAVRNGVAAGRDGPPAGPDPGAGLFGSARFSVSLLPGAASWHVGNSWRGNQRRIGQMPEPARLPWQRPDSPSAWPRLKLRPSGIVPTPLATNPSPPASGP